MEPLRKNIPGKYVFNNRVCQLNDFPNVIVRAGSVNEFKGRGVDSLKSIKKIKISFVKLFLQNELA